MNSPVIRPLAAGDQPEWRRLWRLYLEFYETVVDERVFEATFERLLSSDERDFHALVLERDGGLGGLAHYLFHRHCWKIEDVCYLQDLYVDRDLRGTGCGRALMEAVYAAADGAGSPSVYWLTQHFNEAGRRLYDRVGTVTPFIRYVR